MDPKETNIYTAVLIACIVIGSMVVYFVVSIVRQQRRNLDLTRQNILTELTAIERERSRIAVDLHDDLGPILSVIKFQIDSLTAKDDERALQVSVSAHIDNIIGRLREISNDLMPTSLLRKGLIPSLEEFTKSVQRATKIKFHLDVDNMVDLQEGIRINIYRIVKELIHNSVKHAKPSEISIHFKVEEKKLSILYYDNGTGFNYAETMNDYKGFGLQNLQSRTELMAGTILIESKQNKGSAFKLVIPLP